MMTDDRKVGLYGKYRVERLSDPAGKHKDCWYFVLDLKHDKFATPALLGYAAACEEEYPALAIDLRKAALRAEEKAETKPNPLIKFSLAALQREIERRDSLEYQRRVSRELKARCERGK
jgi:hypothetical protein